jgi:membrane protease YdiL (CAAX protease family)
MNLRAVNASRLIDPVVVIVICFGWPIVGSVWAMIAGFPTPPFNDAAFVAVIVEELMLGSVALAYLRLRGHELVALVPRPTMLGSLVGLGLYALTMLIYWAVYWFAGTPEPSSEPIEKMIAAGSVSLPWLLAGSIVNGVFEEVFLTGYLQRTLIGIGASVAIGVPVLVRAVGHLYQGPLGTVSVICVGVVFGAYYWRKRQLWPVVVAHIVADVAGFVLRS